MRAARGQAVICVLVFAALANFASGRPRGKYAKQLAVECDALIESAVKRPYGWGWETTRTTADARKRTPMVSMAPGDTPAAAMALLWAGELLKETRYTQAAVNAARGVAASQQSTGQIRENPIFGTSPGGREPARSVPERAATRASLALLLAVAGSDTSRDSQLNAAARRASAWLVKQQARDGGWPSADPIDAAPADAVRIIRLDTADYRDSTLALFLASDSLEDVAAGRAAARSLAKLLSLKLNGPDRLQHLWCTAYRMNGQLLEDRAEHPVAMDVLATRHAMQTLLGAGVLTRDADARLALDAASDKLSSLGDPQTGWSRLYPLDPLESSTTQRFFGPASGPAGRLEQTGTFGLDEVLEAVLDFRRLPAEQYDARVGALKPPQLQIATAIAGLSDQPISSNWPASTEQAREYLERHHDWWEILETPPPSGLAARTRRLWVLLIRTALEARFPDLG